MLEIILLLQCDSHLSTFYLNLYDGRVNCTEIHGSFIFLKRILPDVCRQGKDMANIQETP